MNTLIFIDTNIFLDFYRTGNKKTRLSLLEKINNNHDKIITSNQVEMEYKKKRQDIIYYGFLNKRFKKIDLGDMSIDVFASNRISKAISKKGAEIQTLQKKLKKRIIDMLKNPSKYDPVYKALNKLFKNKCEYNLSRDKKIIDKIKRLALKRFYLGYPPRKDKDTSIGDAINWEWIIYCAKKSKKNIIIVSRDEDYGILKKDVQLLNDWLLEEFKSRVSRRRKITLTNSLTEALKEIEVEISEDEKNAEKRVIDETRVRYQYPTLSLEHLGFSPEHYEALALLERVSEPLRLPPEVLAVLKAFAQYAQVPQGSALLAQQIKEEIQNALKMKKPNDKIEIRGKDFGLLYGAIHPYNYVKFGKSTAKIVSWDNNKIVVEVPSDYGTGINDANFFISLFSHVIQGDFGMIIDVLKGLFIPGVALAPSQDGILEDVVVTTPAGNSNVVQFTYKFPTSMVGSQIKSPCELRVYDSMERVTGLVNGEIKEEIPASLYDEENKTIVIFFPNDTYYYEVVGTGKGEYGLEVTYIENGSITNFTAMNISISKNATHRYDINWSKLSQGKKGVSVKIDNNGDGIGEIPYNISGGNNVDRVGRPRSWRQNPDRARIYHWNWGPAQYPGLGNSCIVRHGFCAL